jgi:hypothetical protein
MRKMVLTASGAGAIGFFLGLIPAASASQAATGQSVYPGSAWEMRVPEAVGMDRTKLDALRDFVGGRGCVVRYGYMVYSWGDPTLRGNVYSACKPWFSHFLFKAVEEGKIPSLDQKVNVWEPRLNDLNAALGFKDRDITWRHLANQTSCYGVKEKPGAVFNYNDYQMALFWDTLFLKVYGVTYDTVDATVLHLQLTDLLQCQDNPTFMAMGTNWQMGLLGVSPRDFARFALLYLREGNWKGTQLISREHARMAVSSPMSRSLPNSAEDLAEVIPGQRTIGRVALPQKQGAFSACYSWLWWVNGVTRQGKHHWPDVPLDELAALVKACPRAWFVLLNGLRYVDSPLGRRDSGLPANYVIEISRLSALLDNEIGQLIASLGAERLVLGTGMPFSYPDPALLKLEVLAASKEDKEKIGWQNIAQWLRL